MKLNDPITDLQFVGEVMAKKLKRLSIETVSDLLFHVPSRYGDFSKVLSIAELRMGETVTVHGQIVSIRNIYTKTGKVMQEALVSDGEDSIPVVWFRQTYLVRNLPPGTFVALTGKISFWGKKRVFMAPAYEKITTNRDSLHSGRIVSIYPETSGVTSKWLRRLVDCALKEIETQEYLPSNVITQNNLKNLNLSLASIHQPETTQMAEEGRKRLAFDELLGLELGVRERKKEWLKHQTAIRLNVPTSLVLEFMESLPFSPTKSQIRSMKEIAQELSDEIPMNRLLEGDVGSGKTLVAAFAAFTASKSDASTLFMAPTQILAEQHAKTLKSLLGAFGIEVVLVTASSKTKDMEKIAVYVGTHALLFKYISQQVGLLVIDEQHRFGVTQRAKLTENSEKIPHVLTMTATPIPRTIALTLYGDLNLSTLDELPSGRKKINTWVVPPKKRDAGYKWIDNQIESEGAQVFVVCPIITESVSEKMKEVKNATEEYERLKILFPKWKIGLLHGRMKREVKNEVLDAFRARKYDILVTTPVVEVGIDIPNATIMVIEAAERFGLAALHQLRGRVGRGDKQSYCLLMSESKSKDVQARLSAMSKTLNGRELAELDLNLRGPGEIFGTKQSGVPELKIARWTDIELIKAAKSAADTISTDRKSYKKVMEHFRSLQKAPN